MSQPKLKAIILVPFVILVLILVLFTLSYLIMLELQIPIRLGFSLPVRASGLIILLLGFSFFVWLFQYRKPMDVIISTYATFSKVGRRARKQQRLGRTEPLVVRGPYKYVRNPLYSGVLLMLLGWWLLLDYSFLPISTVLLLLWFKFVVIPFEERELRAIFGEQYERYAREVPQIIPFPKATRK